MTTIPQKGTYHMRFSSKGSFLKLGDHEVSKSINELGLSEKPIITRYYVERSGILPAGQVIETGVAPVEGYLGKDREGKHETFYTD